MFHSLYFLTIFLVWVTCMGLLHLILPLYNLFCGWCRHMLCQQSQASYYKTLDDSSKYCQFYSLFTVNLVSLLGYYQILLTGNYVIAQPTCATSIIFLPFQVGDPKKCSCATHDAFLLYLHCEPLVPWFGKTKFLCIVFLFAWLVTLQWMEPHNAGKPLQHCGPTTIWGWMMQNSFIWFSFWLVINSSMNGAT